MKRALFIVLTDHAGGAERIATTLARDLAKHADWQVDFYVAGAKAADSFTSETLPPNVRIRYGPVRAVAASFLLLPLRLVGRGFDLAFATHIYTNAMLSGLRRLRLVRIGRLVTRESTSLFDRFSGIKARIFRLLYRCYGAEDLLIAQTARMADHVRPSLPSKSKRHLLTRPNPVGVELIESRAGEPLDSSTGRRLSGQINILFCGRFAPVKRPDVALEAFAGLPERVRISARLFFMGRGGSLEKGVRERARQLGLEEDVIFLGHRSNPYSVMAACHIGLVSSDHEGFPNVILEMMACGIRKIVTTPCAGDLDSFPGIIVTPDHRVEGLSRALAAAILSGQDCSAEYKAALSQRSVEAYLQVVLGDPGRRAITPAGLD